VVLSDMGCRERLEMMAGRRSRLSVHDCMAITDAISLGVCLVIIIYLIIGRSQCSSSESMKLCSFAFYLGGCY